MDVLLLFEKGEEEVSFLSPHGENSAFRCMVLYFVRQALRVLENQLYAYYNPRKEKKARRRKKRIKVCSNDTLDERKNPLYDFSSASASKMLNELGEGEKESLRLYFKEELRYVSLKSFDEWRGWIDSLREVRHFLEHYDDRIKEGKDPKGVKEGQFFRLLGRIVLPKLAGLLEGQLKSKQWQKGYVSSEKGKREWEWEKRAGLWEGSVGKGRGSRKWERREYNNTTRRRGNMCKTRRAIFANEDKIFSQNYGRWFPSEEQNHHAYRLENLRDIHFSLGRDMLAKMSDEGGCRSFSEVEELYSLHHSLGFRTWLSLEHLKRKWLGAKKDKGFTKAIKGTQFYKDHKCAGENCILLRNAIVHGRMPFMEEEGGRDYFFGVLMALRFEKENAEYDRLYSDMGSLLKNVRRIEVHFEDGTGESLKSTMRRPPNRGVREIQKLDDLREEHKKIKKSVILKRYRYLHTHVKFLKKSLKKSCNEVENVFAQSKKKP